MGKKYYVRSVDPRTEFIDAFETDDIGELIKKLQALQAAGATHVSLSQLYG